MTYRMFLDDERDPPDDGEEWCVCRSSARAIGVMAAHGLPSRISFDHDLGGSDTAMVVVHWLQNRLVELDRGRPFTYCVHSQNPVGKANIEASWAGFDRMYVPFTDYSEEKEHV